MRSGILVAMIACGLAGLPAIAARPHALARSGNLLMATTFF